MEIEEWTELWGTLCHQFGRDPHAGLAERYLDQLERAGLTDEEIRRGVDRVIWDAGSIYGFPGGKQIAEAGRGDSVRIEEEWERILRLQRYQARKEEYPEEKYERPSKAAMRALQQLGGLEALHDADPRHYERFRRAFREAYEAFAREPAPELPEPEVTEESRQIMDEAGAAVKEV